MFVLKAVEMFLAKSTQLAFVFMYLIIDEKIASFDDVILVLVQRVGGVGNLDMISEEMLKKYQ